jgi:O-antigen/teichoic acid export membrane protein
LYATEGKEKNEKIFRSLNLLNLWFVIFTSVCFLVLFQPFITLWIGEEYLFEQWVVFIIVMNYATNNMQGVTYIFRQATGLFVVGKYRPVASVISNLVLSLIMVRSMGVGGVFLASIISRMTLAWWYDAWIVYKKGFGKSPWGFYIDSAMAAAWIALLSKGIQVWIALIDLPVSWGGLIVRGFICTVVVNLTLLLWYGRREEFNLLKEKGMEILRRKMR